MEIVEENILIHGRVYDSKISGLDKKIIYLGNKANVGTRVFATRDKCKKNTIRIYSFPKSKFKDGILRISRPYCLQFSKSEIDYVENLFSEKGI